MGSCFSSAAITRAPFPVTAKVIALDGSLREYSSQVKVYEVLGRHHPSCFICSSDELYCNTSIPALGSQDSLQLGQLYFVLPVSKLGYPLSGSDMAALAVKASLALSDLASRNKGRGRRMIQVMPVAADNMNEADAADGFKSFPAGNNMGADHNHTWRSSEQQKKTMMMRRSASFRAKFKLRRSYRERLSTIEEVAD